MNTSPIAPRRNSDDKVSIGQYQIPRDYVWQGKLKPAFWSLGSALSLALNVVLILVIIFLGREIFALKNLVSEQLIGRLYYNFVLMDQAAIRDNISVNQPMPIQFDLRVQTNTTVTLTQDTRIQGAQVSVLSSPTDIVLPAGTRLPISMDMLVPVNATIQVNLEVPIDIPLNQTELHEPFTGLQDVVAPYYNLLNSAPSSWGDWFCRTIFGFLCG